MKSENALATAAPLAALALLLAPMGAQAQEMEPRAYSNAPVGLNFFIAAYAHSEGGLSTDPSLPVQDAQLKIHTGVLAYARSLDLWGLSGKVDVIVPFSRLSGSALVAGQVAQREASGFGDPRLRVSVNLYGAPALPMREFAAYQQDLVVGASIQVSAPGGQYDSARAVNLATNRWAVKPDIGLSKTLGAFTVDVTAGVIFYGDNDDYFGGKRLEQAPIYSAQANLSYALSGGAWVALGATYYQGGRTTVNGARGDDALGNSRIGATLALPVDRNQSIKFNASRGVTTRVGTRFNTVGLAWQYRWGAGL
jgi:hypothetical protein